MCLPRSGSIARPGQTHRSAPTLFRLISRTWCAAHIAALLSAALLRPEVKAVYNSGDLDLSFGVAGKVITDFSGGYNPALSVALQPDGKIVVTGSAPGNEGDFAVARYNSDGSLDQTFGLNGLATTDFFHGSDSAFDVVVQPNGKIVVAGACDVPVGSSGYESQFALARFTSDGYLDTTFGSAGKVNSDFSSGRDIAFSLALQAHGKIVVAGQVNRKGTNLDFAVARYNGDGSLDKTFGLAGKVTTDFGGGLDQPHGVAIQSDGKIVVAGIAYTGIGQRPDFAVARYHIDGNPDLTFGLSGKALTPIGHRSQAYSVALQPDGKIVVAGWAYFPGFAGPSMAVARYNSNGSLDATFGKSGIVAHKIGSNDYARCVAVQSDGKIVIAGQSKIADNYDFALARYHSEGSPDTTFGSGGVVITDFFGADDFARGLALQNDGKIVVAGYTTGTYTDFAIARYLP